MASSPSPLPALRLFKGHTAHQRFTPVEHKFSYRLFLLDLDIDRLDEANGQSGLFSVNGVNLFSFRPQDHGNREDTNLRPWAEHMFAGAGIQLDGGTIRLVTLPRHLFYKFAPISLWFGYDPSGALSGIIYEVNNTFGQSHSYVARADGKRSQHKARKQLYVSPFFDVTGNYKFTLRAPDDQLGLVIENMVLGERQHMASIKAKALKANNRAFAAAAILHPLSSLGVTLAIHYEALKLWIKGAGYRSNPGAPADASSFAAPIGTAENTLEQ